MRSTIVVLGCLLASMPAIGEAPTKKPSVAAPKKLLIVAPGAFHNTLAPFVEHKKNLLPTEVVTLDAILKNTKGVDDAERLKRYLYNRWKADKIGYVLLVGDVQLIPVRHYAVMDLGKGVVACYLPSDLYYSDLAKKDESFEDWNANKEGNNAGYFAQLQFNTEKESEPVNVDQIDYLPDVALGRWPVHTVPQLQAVIAKTIRYENHVLADDIAAIRRSAFVLGPNATDTRRDMENWGKKLEAVSTWRPIRRYAKYEGGDFPVSPPNEEEVVKILENGVGMIFHDGHGNWDSWDCLNINRVRSLKDAGLPPVMFSLGCSTALFAPNVPEMPYVDIHGKQHPGTSNKEVFNTSPPPPHVYQRGVFNPSSLGVEWVRVPRNGCVAYIGAANTAAGRNNVLVDGFVDWIMGNEQPRLGDAWSAGIVRYFNELGLATIKAKDWNRVADFHQGMLFQLFGDPSMRLPRAPNPAVNLLINGSFEDGPEVKDYVPLDPGSTAIKGWKVTRGQIDILGDYKAADGNMCVDLHGSPGYGGIEQTFATKKGRRYRVTFSLAGSPKVEVPIKRRAVRAAGESREFTFNSNGKTLAQPGWVTKEWEFSAIDEKTTLEFYTLEKSDAWHGPAVDNVRVAAVSDGKKQ